MAEETKKISTIEKIADFDDTLVAKLADRPNSNIPYGGVGGLTPAELKARFDASSRKLKAKVDEIIDALKDGDALDSILVEVDGKTISAKQWITDLSNISFTSATGEKIDKPVKVFIEELAKAVSDANEDLSDKADKTEVQDWLDKKVDKTEERDTLYATDQEGKQVNVKYYKGSVPDAVVQRTDGGHILIPILGKGDGVYQEGWAVPKKFVQDGLDGKLDKPTAAWKVPVSKGKDQNGNIIYGTMTYTGAPQASAIPFWSSNGTLKTNKAVDDNDTVNKEYVDGLQLGGGYEADGKLKVFLYDPDGTVISSHTFDLPFEQFVQSGELSEDGTKIILTLNTGNTVEIGVSEIVGGLASKDYVDTGLLKKVDKITPPTNTEFTDFLYGRSGAVDGFDRAYNVTRLGEADTIAKYLTRDVDWDFVIDGIMPDGGPKGCLLTGTPTYKYLAANKQYVDTGLAGKVGKTTTANKVYGTDKDGNQTVYGVNANVDYKGSIVQRNSEAQINVPLNQTSEYNATSKNYVDTELAKKLDADTTSGSGYTVVYSRDAMGKQQLIPIIAANQADALARFTTKTHKTWGTKDDNGVLVTGYPPANKPFLCAPVKYVNDEDKKLSDRVSELEGMVGSILTTKTVQSYVEGLDLPSGALPNIYINHATTFVNVMNWDTGEMLDQFEASATRVIYYGERMVQLGEADISTPCFVSMPAGTKYISFNWSEVAGEGQPTEFDISITCQILKVGG